MEQSKKIKLEIVNVITNEMYLVEDSLNVNNFFDELLNKGVNLDHIKLLNWIEVK